MDALNESGVRRKPKPGILRLDIKKPRSSSRGSVEFSNETDIIGEGSSSPQSQVSVKWAYPFDAELLEKDGPSYESLEKNYLGLHNRRKKTGPSYFGFNSFDGCYIDPLDAQAAFNNSEDEDYSVSMSAVMQRRASQRGSRKKSHRTSSPMGHVSGNTIGVAKGGDRRRSSVYTTSSGETAISMGDGTQNQDSTKDQILENIRLHKELLQSVKLQPWSMRRKLRLVRQAKEYIALHEGALQERFAMSRSTKDLWARFKIVLAVKWNHLRRELVNISTLFIPWQLRIKEIESHFGSVVASYFTFLRWLFWVNIVIAVMLTVFVVCPEFLASQWPPRLSDHRKEMLPSEQINATSLITIWDFEGFLKYSPLFYGYYSDFSGAVRWHYDLPLAYFLTGLVVYIYSFWATLRKMAENSRMSKLSSKDDECVFSWKLFTGWDFMIGHAETAHNRIASVVLGFKEALLEEAEKKKDTRNWKVIVLRIFVNFLVLCLLVVSASAVVFVVNRSTQDGANDSYWRRNEITIVITAISTFFPMFFEGLGFLESYHPRKQLRMQLARIMALNLLNLYSLIFALFDKIGNMNKHMDEMRINENVALAISALNGSDVMGNTTDSMGDGTTIMSSAKFIATTVANAVTGFSSGGETMWDGSASTTMLSPNCRQIEVNCTKTTAFNKSWVTSLVFLTTTVLPEIYNRLNMSSTTFGGFNTSTSFDNTSSYDYYDTSSVINFNATVDFENFTETNNISTPFSTERTPLYDDNDDEDYGEEGEEGEEVTMRRTVVVTTPKPPPEKVTRSYEEYYDEPDDDERRKRDVANVYEEIERYNGVENHTWYDGNFTDFLSSTITTFMDNYTIPDGDWNATEVTEMWTTFVNDIDESTSTTVDGNDDDDDDDEKVCYEIVCDPSDIDINEEDYTTFNYDEKTTTDATTATVFTCPTLPTTPTLALESMNASKKKYIGQNLTAFINHMEMAQQMNLRKLCWETMFGQELVKLTVMDLVATITSVLFMDFFRALFVRFMNKCWCWDLEKKFPKYGDFKIAENILHLVNNQGQVWMGMFFSPGLAILNLVKLMILMYLRSWAVLTCNVPHEIVFRASRSNNFYLALLLTMLFLCVLPVGYAIVWIKPSWHCGPFSNHTRIHLVFTDTLRRVLPVQLHRPLDYIASPSTVIPLLLLLILIIYYLISLTNALREANEDLKNQLRRERQEERRKMLQRVVTAKMDDSGAGSNAMDRWRKVLEASSPLTPNAPGQIAEQPDEDKLQARKEFLARIMKKALRKGSNTSEDESHDVAADDETDTENHESLPHDRDALPEPKAAPVRRSKPRRAPEEKKQVEIKPVRKPSFARMMIDAAKREQAARAAAEAAKTPAPTKKDDTLPPQATQDDEDEDLNEKVVSERRMLRRQQSIAESIASGSLPKTDSIPTEKDDVNYEVVNEKNTVAEKKAKQKITVNMEPEIFKFDEVAMDDVRNDAKNEKNKKTNGQNGSTKKPEVRPKPKVTTVFNQSNSSNSSPSPPSSGSANDIPPKAANTSTLIRRERDASSDRTVKPVPPKYAVVTKPKDEIAATSKSAKETTPLKKLDIGLAKEKEKEKSDSESASPIDKPIKKFNSILALVRDAVQTRKQEQSPPSPSPSRAATTTSSASSSSRPIPDRVKKYIDDSVSASEDGSHTKTPDSQSLSSQNYPLRRSSKQKRHTTDTSRGKRRDSQSSVWSENIPVIMISKTESEECILEKSTDEVDDTLDDDSTNPKWD